ncbi:hypothetical protein G114_15231 [Aeromonas diversa CDC 2478-85]|uniref:DUF2987 domain-containing protein n=1 Tax=Aeromonas diversa CDC 2478-85 TaxID=1268237 RepID=N9TY94_9GAMM|nr:DUF2987 domain-containing protein [Aeromonas diversa]ENY71035.1 hypothetical protein G114_15231 [Aeromonas diversa CDC 2478-85]
MKSPWIGLLLLAGSVSAVPLELGYSEFYSQMKTFAKGEFGMARLGFYLTEPQSGRRCLIRSASVETLDRHEPATVTADGELRLLFDPDLNLDKAKVVLDMIGEGSGCNMSVQVMADLPSGEVTVGDLDAARQDMQRLLDKMAGMIGKHFLPPMRGVHLEMAQPDGRVALIAKQGERQLVWQKGRLAIDDETLKGSTQDRLAFDTPPLRVTPWLGQ